MAKRKHISWKTRCAAAVYEVDYLRMIHFGPGWENNNTNIPLDHIQPMSEDQYLSLWEWHHQKPHYFSSSDHFTNLRPLPIKSHRAQTKRDIKDIAKSRRIIKKEARHAERMKSKLTPLGETIISAAADYAKVNPLKNWKRTLHSRGFDKTRTRHFDGRVTERKK